MGPRFRTRRVRRGAEAGAPDSARRGTGVAIRGQALVELALVLPVFFLLIFGVIDFGVLMEERIAIINAARDGARYATTHPTAWSNAVQPPSSSIQGQIMSAGGTAALSNDDSHILISYLKPDGSACGHYSTGGFSGSQSSCVVAGNLIQVQVTFTYRMITPMMSSLFPSGIAVSTAATMVEEQ